MVQEAATQLFQYSIYPSADEYKQAAEEFIEENNSEFFNDLTEKQWNTYYKSNLASSVNFYLIYFKIFNDFELFRIISKYFE